MRHIEWRSLPGAFAKPRKLHIRRSKNGLYFCPVDFFITVAFYLKWDAENTQNQSMDGTSTLMEDQKLQMCKSRTDL